MSLKIGENSLPNFTLIGVDEKKYTPYDFKDYPILAIIWSCNHCPYVLAWENRMIKIQKKYIKKGVKFVLINSNDPVQYPDDSFEEMKKRAEMKKYPFPYLFDETQEIAKIFGAQRTPEVFLFNKDRILVYHGAIDDNYESEKKVKNHYLISAITSILKGEEIKIKETKPVGCTVKWKK